MARSRKHNTEWGNPITKEHTWYALIDKWILAQKLGIPKIQFTDQMILKKKKDKSMDTLVLLRRGNKIPVWGETEMKCGAETEGKAIQRLLHLGIHPVYSYQTLLWMPISACWQEPDIAVSWETLSVPNKCRGGFSQPTIGLSPIEKLEKGPKELKELAVP